MSRVVHRLGLTIAITAVTLGLVHVFLFRVPSYLLHTKSSAPAQLVPLAAPDWTTAVETKDGPLRRRSGANAAGDGVPAAPAR